MGGSSAGSGSAPTSANNTDHALPNYIAPYIQNMLGSAQQASLKPYIPYQGTREAPVNSMTTGAYGDINAMNQAGLPGIAGGMGDYTQMAQQYGQNLALPPGSAPQVDPQQISAQQWNGQQAQNYMSPYTQQVIGTQTNQAMLDFQRTQATRDDQAVQAGAFGGSRQGVNDALAQESLGRNLADINATGMNNAWNQAGQMFSSDRNAALAASQSNQYAGMQGGMANQQAFLNQAGQQLTGEQLGIGALGQAGQGMISGQNAQTQDQLSIANAMGAAGQQQQAYQQTGLDINYQNFLNQQQYQPNMLNWYSGILHGVPDSLNTNSVSSGFSNPVSQTLGLGLGGLGMQYGGSYGSYGGGTAGYGSSGTLY